MTRWMARWMDGRWLVEWVDGQKAKTWMDERMYGLVRWLNEYMDV